MHERVAFITGAGGGIGQSTVKRFLREGAKVIACDRDESQNRSETKDTPTKPAWGFKTHTQHANPPSPRSAWRPNGAPVPVHCAFAVLGRGQKRQNSERPSDFIGSPFPCRFPCKQGSTVTATARPWTLGEGDCQSVKRSGPIGHRWCDAVDFIVQCNIYNPNRSFGPAWG